MTTSPESVLKIPPNEKPTTEITTKQNTTGALSKNFSKKKQINNTTIKGIIRSPLFMIFLNRQPIPTDPKIAAKSYVIGIIPDKFARSYRDLKYRGN